LHPSSKCFDQWFDVEIAWNEFPDYPYKMFGYDGIWPVVLDKKYNGNRICSIRRFFLQAVSGVRKSGWWLNPRVNGRPSLRVVSETPSEEVERMIPIQIADVMQKLNTYAMPFFAQVVKYRSPIK